MDKKIIILLIVVLIVIMATGGFELNNRFLSNTPPQKDTSKTKKTNAPTSSAASNGDFSEDYNRNFLSVPDNNFLSPPTRLSPVYTGGKWLDNEEGYTSLDFFSADYLSSSSRFNPLIDLRGHCFNNGKLAANLGIGVRYVSKSHQIYGLNTFFDYRETKWNDHLQQVGVGIEALGEILDFRSNGYFPIGDKTIHSPASKFRFDQYVGIRRRFRKAAWGADIEFGKWIKSSKSCHYNVYSAVGAYYFSTKSRPQDAWGVEARIKAGLGKYFILEVRGGYDPVYNGSVQVSLSLKNLIPYHHSSSADRTSYGDLCWKNLLYQPIQRQEIIVEAPKVCRWKTNWE